MSLEILNDSNFNEEVSEGLVLVDFYADWCGPCKMLAPVLDEFNAEYNDKVKVFKLDVDENSVIPSEYGVMSIPTLLVFKDGELINKVSGFRDKDGLVSLVGLN